MIQPSWYFYGLLLPALLCSGVVLTTGWLFNKERVAWVVRGPGWAIAIAAGFVAGYHAVDGWPPLPPTESQHWLVLVLLPAAVVCGSLGPHDGVPLMARIVVRAIQLLVAAATPTLLLQSYVQYQWSTQQAVAWLAGLGGYLAILWLLTDLLKERLSERLVLTSLVVTAGGTGIVILMSGSQSLGQLGLSLTVILVAGWVVSWFVPQAVGKSTTMGVVLVLLAGLWINAHYYASMTATNTVLLAVSPLGLWLSQLPIMRRMTGWRWIVIRLVVILGPVMAAVIMAAVKFSHEMAKPSYY